MIPITARTETAPAIRPETELALEGQWHVVVLNDPVNLMSYVVLVFRRVFGFDEPTARRHMLEVHEQRPFGGVDRGARKGRGLRVHPPAMAADRDPGVR